MLVYDRTEYNDGHPRVFHVTTNTSAAYSDLCSKYGADNVFRGDTLKPIADAHAACLAGRGDLIRIWPGTYTDAGTADATAVTISKAQVTIEGATRNAPDVILAAGADCEMFSLAATADGTQFKHLTFSLDTSSTTPQDGIEVIAGCDGVLISDCIFVGADKATVAIDAEGDRLTVQNCRFEDVKTAIQSNGAYCRFINNYFNSDNTGACAIELTDGVWSEVIGNRFDLSGGTGDVGVKYAATCYLGQCVGNVFHASLSDNINPVSGATVSYCNNQETGTTATIAYVIT